MYQDVKVIDRLGAGDAFASGFLSQWSQGKSLKESIVFASANSTSVVTKIGAKAGILHKGFKLHEMPLMEKALWAVSYTHLDVYKSQPLHYFEDASRIGVSKININSDMRYVFRKTLEKVLADNPTEYAVVKLMPEVYTLSLIHI